MEYRNIYQKIGAKWIWNLSIFVILICLISSCSSKKAPFYYVSLCPIVFQLCENKINQCGKETNAYGLEQTRAGCDYLKLPSDVDVDLNIIHPVSIYTSIKKIYPKSNIEFNDIGTIYDSFGVEQLSFKPFTAYIQHVKNAYGMGDKTISSNERFGMDVYVLKMRDAVSTNLVYVPKTLDSVISCSMYSWSIYPERTVCHVTADVDNKLRVKYNIPYGDLVQFKETNAAYVEYVRHLIYEYKK